jgi:IS1 family transposase
MNRVPAERRTQIINCLVEGNSIRSTERMTETHRDTSIRLLVEVGESCAALMDAQMQRLPYRHIEVDEIWTYVQKKQRWITDKDDTNRIGDMWTFAALDADTKLVPTYRVGKRDFRTTSTFMSDLSSRLVNRVQLSSDALRIYVEATKQAFGADVDYGQIVKFYEAEPISLVVHHTDFDSWSFPWYPPPKKGGTNGQAIRSDLDGR